MGVFWCLAPRGLGNRWGMHNREKERARVINTGKKKKERRVEIERGKIQRVLGVDKGFA